MRRRLLVVPTYNEADKIGRIKNYASKLGQNVRDLDLLFVDGGSLDGTAEKLSRLGFKVFRPESGRWWKGESIKKGWDYGLKNGYEYLGYVDGDFPVKPDDIALVYYVLEKFPDAVIIGSRYLGLSNSMRKPYRLFFSKIFHLMANTFYGVNINDFQCGLKALKAEVWKEITYQVSEKHWGFDQELILLAASKGYKIIEVPVSWVEMEKAPRLGWLIRTVAGHLKTIGKLSLTVRRKVPRDFRRHGVFVWEGKRPKRV